MISSQISNLFWIADAIGDVIATYAFCNENFPNYQTEFDEY